jgi:hypothetical protein
MDESSDGRSPGRAAAHGGVELAGKVDLPGPGCSGDRRLTDLPIGLSDTSPEAQQILIEGYRRMTPTQKLQRVESLDRALVLLQKARIRADYGDIPDEEMRMRLGALRLGRETMMKVFGWDPEEKGW